MNKFKSTFGRAVATAASASALLIAGTVHAALQDRDLDGDSVVDAFYDTELDITWLRAANVNGRMTWEDAVAWADGFSFAGYSDWRLPMSDTCGGFNCIGSEMGHLWYVELGNWAGRQTNTGNFENIMPIGYWSGTEYAPRPEDAWFFDTDIGGQYADQKEFPLYAMAVRDGDVPAIPEPQTFALMLAGLGGLALAWRRRSS